MEGGATTFCKSSATRLGLGPLLLCATLASVVGDAGVTRGSPRASVLREEAGKALLRSRDETIDPCDDFYRHACGEWVADNPLESSEFGVRQESQLRTKVLEQLRESLEERGPSDTAGAAKKAKDFYRSCVKEDSDGSIGQLASMVAANGGWPLTVPSSRWALSEKFGLREMYENYVRRGAYWPLLQIRANPEGSGGGGGGGVAASGQPNVLTVRASVPPFKFWQAFNIKAKDVNLTTYESYVKKVARKFVESGGFEVSPSDTDRDVDDAIAFERALWNATVLSNGARNVSTTIADFQIKWNSAVAGRPELAIDWLRVIRGSFEGTGVAIDEGERISLRPRDNIAAIGRLLQKTPIRTIANYFHWYVIHDALRLTTNERFIDKNLLADRSEWCIDQQELNHAYSYVYVRKYFSNASHDTAAEVVSRIQWEFKRQLNRTTWLNDEEKLRSVTSIDDLRKRIGYPSWYDEPGKIDEYYRELNIGSRFFENMLSIRRFNEILSGKALRKPYAERVYPSYETSLRFDTDNNILTLPAGSLQLPLFHPEIPRSMNYGGTGFAVTSNVAYAFLYDGVFGLGDRVPFFSASGLARYNDTTKCFVDQYEKYTLTKVDGRTIFANGRSNLLNHLVDNIGVRLAYDSYKRGRDIGQSVILALNRYADERLLFYSIANQFCSIHPADSDTELAIMDQIRVNQALSNFNEFSEAFHCSNNTRMNPQNKCALFEY